jgi:hypothetical protein
MTQDKGNLCLSWAHVLFSLSLTTQGARAPRTIAFQVFLLVGVPFHAKR